VQVEFDSTKLGVRDVVELIERTGPYAAQLARPEGSVEALKREKEIRKWRLSFFASLAFTAPLVFISMVLSMLIEPTHEMLQQDYFVRNLSIDAVVQWALATPVQFWIGWDFYVASYKGTVPCFPRPQIPLCVTAYYVCYLLLLLLL
jgi:Cu+-exporting ATPase